ncbi:acyl-CoA N-acyltransferase [Lepidopterella palustris CBS 459.81]|uniref:Acyl-CoA N-acyltransferase n=1 Tax=Lepidopterella palustris CBS 459.81 TaxID=1314670 RepID=A0A8E2EJV5_9PEZI|nr:acyl-CoA N-acyltransferase [Lepidopterella palustris CBS 459.81]
MVADKEVEIRTRRLVLRPLRLEDAPDVFLLRSSATVMRFTPSLPDNDVEQSREWIAKCLNRSNCWNFSMELLPLASSNSPTSTRTPRVIGVLGAIRTPEVGYMINEEFWGKGYASEALQAFMPVFFANYSGEKRYDYAEAHVDPEHIPSRKVLEKAGFTLLEIREADFSSPTLGLRDTCIYRMPRPGELDNKNSTEPAGS